MKPVCNLLRCGTITRNHGPQSAGRVEGMAPVEAVEKVLHKAGWNRDQVDLYELNEAFAVQSVALIRELDLDPGEGLAIGR